MIICKGVGKRVKLKDVAFFDVRVSNDVLLNLSHDELYLSAIILYLLVLSLAVSTEKLDSFVLRNALEWVLLK